MVAPLVVSAASMVALAATMGSHAGLAFASLMGAVLAWAPGGILSAYPSAYLSGPAAASGWAVVNAVGALVGGEIHTTPLCLPCIFNFRSSRSVQELSIRIVSHSGSR